MAVYIEINNLDVDNVDSVVWMGLYKTAASSRSQNCWRNFFRIQNNQCMVTCYQHTVYVHDKKTDDGNTANLEKKTRHQKPLTETIYDLSLK